METAKLAIHKSNPLASNKAGTFGRTLKDDFLFDKDYQNLNHGTLIIANLKLRSPINAMQVPLAHIQRLSVMSSGHSRTRLKLVLINSSDTTTPKP